MLPFMLFGKWLIVNVVCGRNHGIKPEVLLPTEYVPWPDFAKGAD